MVYGYSVLQGWIFWKDVTILLFVSRFIFTQTSCFSQNEKCQYWLLIRRLDDLSYIPQWFFSSSTFLLKVSLPHANCHSTTGLHVFISDELEDEGKFKRLSAYLAAYTTSYMIRRKSKLYSWMIDYKLRNFLMLCNVISLQLQPWRLYSLPYIALLYILTSCERRQLFSIHIIIQQSHYRHGQVLRAPGGWGCQNSRQSAHERSKVVIPMHRPALHPRDIPSTHFC
jgi:hypothetical protein